MKLIKARHRGPCLPKAEVGGSLSSAVQGKPGQPKAPPSISKDKQLIKNKIPHFLRV